MRKGNDSSFLIQEEILLGVNLGADFTAEHEWGIAGIKQAFGIPSGDKDWGIKRREITRVPSDFGWTKGAMAKSQGLYLVRHYDGKVPDFSKDGELRTWSANTLACAWDDKTFGVFSTDAQEIEYLKSIYDAFKGGDGAIFMGGGGHVFQRSGLVLAIASRISQEFLNGWYEADKAAYLLDQEVEATGIRQLLKERKCSYFALSPRRADDGSIIYWLNPMEQHANNYGWFKLEDLQEWTDAKGKIPKALAAKG